MIQLDKLSFEHIYYVECKERALNPLAIRPELQQGRVLWEDTSRGTDVKVQKIALDFGGQEYPKAIDISTTQNLNIRLTLLTLDIYNKNVKHRVAGKPEFPNEESLISYFLNTNFENY